MKTVRVMLDEMYETRKRQFGAILEFSADRMTVQRLTDIADYWDCSLDYLAGRSACPDILERREPEDESEE